MPEPIIVTEYDVKDHNLLLRHLRKVGERILRMDGRLEQVERRPTGITAQDASRELQATGRAPLRVDNLQGVLTNPQPAKAQTYSTPPSGQVLQALSPDQLIVVGTTSTGDKLYRVIGGNPNTLREIVPAISGSSISVADNQLSIYDNGDNTRILQFECASITAGNTRVMTIPDVSQILAGRDVNNNFSTNQSFGMNVVVTGDVSAAAITATSTFNGTTATLTGILTLNGGIRLGNTLSVTTTPVTLAENNIYVFVNTSTGAKTVNLHAGPTAGNTVIIKDDSNNAGVNNITVAGNGSNIDGAASYVIAVNGMAAFFIYNGAQWNILRNT